MFVALTLFPSGGKNCVNLQEGRLCPPRILEIADPIVVELTRAQLAFQIFHHVLGGGGTPLPSRLLLVAEENKRLKVLQNDNESISVIVSLRSYIIVASIGKKRTIFCEGITSLLKPPLSLEVI